MYMERLDRLCTDVDSYTHTQTDQSGNETTGTVQSDRSCTVHANEQYRYGLRLGTTVKLACKLLCAAVKAIVDIGPDMPRQS